jgi:hypothetical protein
MGLLLALTLPVVAGYPLGQVLPYLLPNIFSWGVSGFLAGAGFGTLLTAMERRRTLEELSLGRVTLWGAVGGVGISVLVMAAMAFLVYGIEAFANVFGSGVIAVELVKAALFGGGSALGTTLLAKRVGESQEPGTLEEGDY